MLRALNFQEFHGIAEECLYYVNSRELGCSKFDFVFLNGLPLGFLADLKKKKSKKKQNIISINLAFDSLHVIQY